MELSYHLDTATVLVRHVGGAALVKLVSCTLLVSNSTIFWTLLRGTLVRCFTKVWLTKLWAHKMVLAKIDFLDKDEEPEEWL